MSREPELAVVVPCRNEAKTIALVIAAFRKALPQACCYVYDNGSTDGTVAAALAAGAVVCSEPVTGKGNAVRRMFADVDADIYILVDGDATYDADDAPAMVEMLVADDLDMIVGARVPADGHIVYPRGHVFGNALLNWLIRTQFGGAFSDISSGYRVLSKRLVKSFPAFARRFEIEPELATHCATLRLPCAEVRTRYSARPSGSSSKLRTVHDGGRALFAIGMLIKEVHPFRFFSFVALVVAALALALALPIAATYVDTGLVPRLPTAVLCVGLVLISVGSFFAGVILDSVSRTRNELKRMAYLRFPSVREALGLKSRPSAAGGRSADFV